MSINLKIFLLLIVLIFIIIIFQSIKKKRLLLKYSLLWIASAILMIICIVFPQILTLLCNLLKVELVSNLVFLISILILLLLTFVLTIIVSEQKGKITLLVQEIAIIKNELEKGRKNDKKLN